ncbi:cytochrome c oxidase assembly protein [Nevskia sp.]|uniref:cytochrome c oxidase assembly protein n=1 Tax=Nevskia sp. TaxID=1929292 RepID=UPI0025F19014|nr:cytochrome c oxidase assembly protein [Nevskia sp.]
MKKPVISNSRGLWKLLVVVAGMFCFGFVLVPMYNAICQLVNLNGKDSAMLVSAKDVVEREDATRTVKVEFVTTVNGGRVFSFRAEQPSVQVHPGKLYTVDFVARNERDEAVIGQAVPSVAPWNAARHLRKTECFCFSQQPFAANEEKRMPVRFMLDPELPADVEVVTLSYTFFDATALAAGRVEEVQKQAVAVPKS